MPIPSPRKNEEKNKFLDRCMADGVMNKEFKDPKQRYAVCLESWQGKSHSSKSKFPLLDMMEK